MSTRFPSEEVIGFKCEFCSNWATHLKDDHFICCECHGGFFVFNKEMDGIHKEHLRKLKEEK